MYILLFIAVAMTLVAIIKKPSSIYANKPEEKNPMEGKKVRFVSNEGERENADGVRGHLEAIGTTEHRAGFYEKTIKRCLDVIFSFFVLVLLSPVFLVLSLWIAIDDPGPVMFKQKRIGRNKQCFVLHKFRTMKMSAPNSVPTHMLQNSG